MAAVKSGNKWGFIDTAGKVVIPFQYNDAYPFNEGLAKVNKEGHFGFVNSTGNEVIITKYTFAGKFSDGVAPVCNEKSLWGYIDKMAKRLLALSMVMLSHIVTELPV